MGAPVFGRSTKAEIFPGVSLIVPRPEHLAEMKVQALKDRPERWLKDLLDIQELLELPGVTRKRSDVISTNMASGSDSSSSRHGGDLPDLRVR